LFPFRKELCFRTAKGKDRILCSPSLFKNKEDVVYELETECGKIIRATKEHEFLTQLGMKMLSD